MKERSVKQKELEMLESKKEEDIWLEELDVEINFINH